MDFISKEIIDYCLNMSSAESDLLNKINRQTHLNTTQPRMLSGHLQGNFLSILSKLKQPVNALEIGVFTGYSALCIAEGLTQNGSLYCIDNNEETNLIAQNYFNESKFKNNIKLLQGNALDIIPTLKPNFDLVFIDADKKNYINYYNAVFDKVNKGGLIIIDNVLWSGKVITNAKDEETQTLQQLNLLISKDNRVKSQLLPLRDGLFLIVKN
ncbi:MAG: O-methyltransferase [Bacteroidetes bacterium]|nr:O-methyltransferase [Bacteroidota bacterium]